MSNEVGYVRLYGIPEVDLIIKAKIAKMTKNVYVDYGGKLDEYLEIPIENQSHDLITLANICLANVDVNNLPTTSLGLIEQGIAKIEEKCGAKVSELDSEDRVLVVMEIYSVLTMLNALKDNQVDKLNVVNED